MSGSTSRKKSDRAMYSLSVVEKEISVWSFEHQITEQAATMMTYLVRDMTDDGASLQAEFHSPAKEASTYVSILLVRSGLYRMPYCLIRLE